jgi:LacI family transcriptional regulator
MADVARAAGVSLATVSNVLNNPARVTERTRSKVEAAIAELGFVRNGVARSLKAGTSTTLGFVVTDLSNSFFLDMIRGAEDAASRSGMNLLLADADRSVERQRTYLDLFEEERVAGILLAPRQDTAGQLDRLRARGVPLVVLNDGSLEHEVCTVTTDNVRGGYLAARHLIELGRRRLLFAGSDRFPVVHDRFRGVRRAVSETRGAVSLERVRTAEVRVDDGREIGAQIVARSPEQRPDGVLAGADLLAYGLIQALLLQSDLRVPQDVAVVGYDNNREAWSSAVPITTLDQAGEEMGRRAAELLLDQIRSPGESVRRSITLQPFLIPRESTLGR